MESVKPLFGFLCKKVRKTMESSKKYPLEDLVHVDELTVGGKEEGKQGRKVMTQKRKRL
jgi:hypothetical protein